MEGAVSYLKMRDRKLTDHFLALAVKDNFSPVYFDYFSSVTVPWVVGLTACLLVVCLCARADSPACNICDDNTK